MKPMRIMLLTSIAIMLAVDVFAQGTWKTYVPERHYVDAIVVEGDYIWCSVLEGGVERWNRKDGSRITYTTGDGLIDNNVYAITIDSENLKWFATENGVSRFDGISWTSYTTDNGLILNRVISIAVDQNNVKWFAYGSLDGGGVTSFDGSKWTTFTQEDGLTHNTVYSIYVDEDNVKWVYQNLMEQFG